jgi:phenylacetic acid degradation operon negative regulatory protein
MPTICAVETQTPNAPDLVLDLLQAGDRPLSGRALCRAGALLGHRETTMRVALTRLLAARKIRRESRGSYLLHHPGATLLGELRAWSREASDEVAWQGDWVAVHDAGVPRSDKTSWRRHHLALSLRGFAPLAAGLRIRPCNRAGGLQAERQRLADLGLSKQARVFLLSGLDARDAKVAAGLWPTKALEDGYRRLSQALAQHRRLLPRLPEEQALRETLLLGRTAMGRLARDPMLPAEMMAPRHRDKLVMEVRRYDEAGHALWSRWMEAA